MGVPPGLTSIALYSKSAALQLPFSSVTEEFKVAKRRLVMSLRDSQDRMIREAGIQTRSGRKWSASVEVQNAEEMLKLKDVIGNTSIGRQGLGCSKFRE